MSLNELHFPSSVPDALKTPDAAAEWRRLAVQFDGHRMQALSHLQAMLADPALHAESARAFLKAPPLSGAEVLAERIAALQQASPAPVGVVTGFDGDGNALVEHDCERGDPLKVGDCLYDAPVRREPLSGLSRAGIAHAAFGNPIPPEAYRVIDAVEAALQIKA